MIDLRPYRMQIERQKGQRDQLLSSFNAAQAELKEMEKRQRYVEEAKTILQTVAQMTQKELEYHVSELVSLALSAVFDDPYELKLDFVVRREKTEADISFVREEEKIAPLLAAGGGAVDVAAFALRVSMWSLQANRSRNVLILDEPFRFLSRDLQELASRMLTEISGKLGLQIIMVSHNPELIEGAHRSFEVTMKKGVSEVKLYDKMAPAVKGEDHVEISNSMGTQHNKTTGGIIHTRSRRTKRRNRKNIS